MRRCSGPISGRRGRPCRQASTSCPRSVKTETVPSLRLATNASVPPGLIETPAGPSPVSSVAITAGGVALRSITLRRCRERSSSDRPDRAWLAAHQRERLIGRDRHVLRRADHARRHLELADHLGRRDAEIDDGDGVLRGILRHRVDAVDVADAPCRHWPRWRAAPRHRREQRQVRRAAASPLTREMRRVSGLFLPSPVLWITRSGQARDGRLLSYSDFPQVTRDWDETLRQEAAALRDFDPAFVPQAVIPLPPSHIAM